MNQNVFTNFTHLAEINMTDTDVVLTQKYKVYSYFTNEIKTTGDMIAIEAPGKCNFN